MFAYLLSSCDLRHKCGCLAGVMRLLYLHDNFDFRKCVPIWNPSKITSIQCGYNTVSILQNHHNDAIMSATASQITSLVYSTVYSRRRSKKTSKLRVTDLCEGNSPVTNEFPAQRASNADLMTSSWYLKHRKNTCNIYLITSPWAGRILWARSLGPLLLTSMNFNLSKVQ